jgi:hypothetical protein
MYRSSINTIGPAEDPDYVYYNADIINNETRDVAGGRPVVDPAIRFNETRDSAILKDSSQYNFSIIRFTMDGPNADLPAFIPAIQQGTGQTNVNLTEYGIGITYEQEWNILIGGVPTPTTFRVAPPIHYVEYASETQNSTLAPIPRNMANPNLAPSLIYNPVITYEKGQIVGSVLSPYGGCRGPFYEAVQNVPLATPPPNGVYWKLIQNNEGRPQDLSSRYYWVYTITHWVDLVNNYIEVAYGDTWLAFQQQWIASGTTTPFPYPTFQDFKDVVNVPRIVYNSNTNKFTIYADSNGFGPRLEPFTPVVPPAIGALTKPVNRLFFNGNLFNLFSNFDNVYYNKVNTPFTGVPEGYTNELLFANKFFQNVVDYRLAPYSGVPPLGFVPVNQQKVYWFIEQDAPSTTTFWSPISSLVFTSTLLPMRSEFTGSPVILGNGNLGFSSADVQNAFTPIITDIALDTANGSSMDYRKFIYYAPTAEYRLSDFLSSKQEVRNIDIQVFWKNRLDSTLYPITMANLSSVSIKIMFKKKALDTKSDY